MAGVLAQLKVLLGLDATQLKSGLNEAQVASERAGKKIEGSFKGLGRTFARAIGPLSETGRQVSFALQGVGEAAAEANMAFSGLGATVGAFAGIATGGVLALTGLTLKLFQQIDQQADLAKGLGLTTSQYVKLASALKLYGVEQQQITPGLSQFFKIVSGLMRSKAGSEAINQLGLSMKNLRLMDTHQQLMAVADAFSKFPDGPRKSAIAAQLFTATLGAKMIPLLDQGAVGVKKLEANYSDLADNSQKLADTTKNLSIAWSHLVSQAEAGALNLSVKVHIPDLLVALAHPVAAVRMEVEGLIQVFDKLTSEILSGMAAVLSRVPGISKGSLNDIQMASLNYSNSAKAAYLQRELIKAQMESSGETRPVPGGGLPGGLNTGSLTGSDKVAGYLKSLKEQIADFGKGDVAKGLSKLKELGATQAQLMEGKSLLGEINALKEAAKFSDTFAKSQEHLNGILKKIAETEAAQMQANTKLAASFDHLTSSILSAGRSALGLGSVFQDSIKKQAQAAAGVGNGPVGGIVPVFNPSGFGKMRFDMEKLNEDARKLGDTFSKSFVRMIENGQSFGQMLKNLRTEFELFIIKAVVFQEIAKALKGAGGFLGVIGNFFGGMATPGRAMGGPVVAGGLYKVGETGPEYFAPTVSGTIIPESKMGKGGRPIALSQVFNINTPDADSFKKSSGQIMSSAYRQMLAMHSRNS